MACAKTKALQNQGAQPGIACASVAALAPWLPREGRAMQSFRELPAQRLIALRIHGVGGESAVVWWGLDKSGTFRVQFRNGVSQTFGTIGEIGHRVPPVPVPTDCNGEVRVCCDWECRESDAQVRPFSCCNPGGLSSSPVPGRGWGSPGKEQRAPHCGAQAVREVRREHRDQHDTSTRPRSYRERSAGKSRLYVVS